MCFHISDFYTIHNSKKNIYDDKPTEGNDKSNDGRTCRNFQNRWLSLYLWLSFDGNLMFFLLLWMV
jgi:hypothetical protein